MRVCFDPEATWPTRVGLVKAHARVAAISNGMPVDRRSLASRLRPSLLAPGLPAPPLPLAMAQGLQRRAGAWWIGVDWHGARLSWVEMMQMKLESDGDSGSEAGREGNISLARVLYTAPWPCHAMPCRVVTCRVVSCSAFVSSCLVLRHTICRLCLDYVGRLRASLSFSLGSRFARALKLPTLSS